MYVCIFFNIVYMDFEYMLIEDLYNGMCILSLVYWVVMNNCRLYVMGKRNVFCLRVIS